MSRIWTYLAEVIQGIERYFNYNKLAAILFAALLAAWLIKPAEIKQKGNRFLVYTVIICVLLLCPVTAWILMKYQTSFYDYEWAWSMVPVTAVIAYIGTLLLKQIKEKRKQILTAVMIVFILILCGNQGKIQRISDAQAEAGKAAEGILTCLERIPDMEQFIVWAPKEIMQQMRRESGEILLVYGRDMWDGKSGAYDYEAYREEIIESYEWLNAVLIEAEVAADFAEPVSVLEILCRDGGLDAAASANVEAILDAGANTIILPEPVAEYLEDIVADVSAQKNMTVDIADAEGYTIFALK